MSGSPILGLVMAAQRDSGLGLKPKGYAPFLFLKEVRLAGGLDLGYLAPDTLCDSLSLLNN